MRSSCSSSNGLSSQSTPIYDDQVDEYDDDDNGDDENKEFGYGNNLTRVSMLMTALTEVAKLDLSLGRQNWFCVASFDSAMPCHGCHDMFKFK